MVRVGRIEVVQIRVQKWQDEVAPERGIGEWNQVRIQERDGSLVDSVWPFGVTRRSGRLNQVCQGNQSPWSQSLNRWAVGKTCTPERERTHRTDIREIEILIYRSREVSLQVLVNRAVCI